MLVKPIVLDYAPRRAFIPFHQRKQRWACLVCHRRAGKSVATVNDLIRRAIIENRADGRYAFVGPYYTQVKDIAWTYLKRFAEPVLAETPRESELSILLQNGARIRLYGADNPDRLRGIYLDGVVLDEFGDMVPSLWTDVLRPALSDRKGWATFIGTPKGKNQFWELWAGDQKGWPGAINMPEWFTLMLKASESKLIDKPELADARLQMGEDQYEQEYECSFEAAIKGAFYADQMREMMAEGRICPIQIDKSVRVHTSWDLGVSDSTSIIFWQCVGRERRAVDYYESSGVGLDHYAQVLFDKRMQYGWQYGEHLFPHDVAQRELGSGLSRIETLRGFHIEPQVVPLHNVLDGINAVRRMLARTWIDPTRCERLIEALRQYRREWDDRLKDWKSNPLHDWTSHGADSARTFSAGFDDPQSVPPLSEKRRLRNDGGSSSWAA